MVARRLGHARDADGWTTPSSNTGLATMGGASEVPEALSAVYLVPASLPDRAVKETVKSALSAHVPDPVGLVARKMLDVGAVRVAVQPSSSLPPLPVTLQRHLGVVIGQRARGGCLSGSGYCGDALLVR